MMAQLMVRSGEGSSPPVRRVSFWIAPATAADIFEAAIGVAMWACGMLLAIRDRGKTFVRLWSTY